jgi:hypothetical protein
MKMDTDNIIADGENYRGKDNNYGYKDIVLKQIQKIINIYSKELVKGFMKYSQPNQYGQQEPIAYVSDGRKSYIQSIEGLYDLLFAKFDKQMKQDDEDINEELNERCAELKDDVNERVRVMRKLFRKMCLFLERMGWLEEQSLED